MAILHEEVVVIKVSKLIKDSDVNNTNSILNDEVVQSLDAIVQELVGQSVLVEIEKA